MARIKYYDAESGEWKYADKASSSDSSQNRNFKTDKTLSMEDGVLSVNTTNAIEQDNTLPITSAGVYAVVGNIEELLKTI